MISFFSESPGVSTISSLFSPYSEESHSESAQRMYDFADYSAEQSNIALMGSGAALNILNDLKSTLIVLTSPPVSPEKDPFHQIPSKYIEDTDM